MLRRRRRAGDRVRLQLDTEKDYGIVLEGGGARGAYQVGAWRALAEAGIRIKGIAGTSVGALNGALICMDDMGKARRIWENICYSRVMDVDDEQMDILMNFSFRQLSELKLSELINAAKRILKDRGFQIGPLRELIGAVIDEDKIRQSKRELYVVTYSLSDRKPLVVDLKEVAEGQMADMLLASAYLIGFHREKLGGKYYLDGAGINNVPADVLIDRGYKDIIVLRIYGIGVDTERHLEVPEDVTLYHIAPRQDLGGLLEFDRKKARRNMLLGYFDAKRMLWGLEGRQYYLDAPEGEAYYLERLMAEAGELSSCLGLQTSRRKPQPGLRGYTEQLLPALAAQLKLREGWDYRDLYLAALEEQARKYHISRYKIYRVDELKQLIARRAARGNISV